ncbi:MAG: helix-turn-helix domain-containing protein, partial [Lachnospiraceae bacterium]|nr:helix-turn-helix domain-containing protein [Lachnospiraceae bacterium]
MATQEYYHITSSYRCIDCVNTLDSDLYVIHCGIENCASRQTFGPLAREGYHLHVILTGQGTLRLQNDIFHLSAGQIFILPNGIEVEYQANMDDPWQYAWFAFSGKNALPCIKSAGFEKTWIRDCNCDPEEFAEIADKIISITELTLANELKRNAYLHEMLALLVRTKSPTQEVRHDFSPDLYVQYAVQFIHLNYAHIKVNDIARYIGINRSYLTAIFKNKLNVSPQEYLVSYRLNKGKQLLSTTNLSIQDIAARIGYDNPLTFSKMFKSTYGKSPRYYRQEFISENSEASETTKTSETTRT